MVKGAGWVRAFFLDHSWHLLCPHTVEGVRDLSGCHSSGHESHPQGSTRMTKSPPKGLTSQYHSSRGGIPVVRGGHEHSDHGNFPDPRSTLSIALVPLLVHSFWSPETSSFPISSQPKPQRIYPWHTWWGRCSGTLLLC